MFLKVLKVRPLGPVVGVVVQVPEISPVLLLPIGEENFHAIVHSRKKTFPQVLLAMGDPPHFVIARRPVWKALAMTGRE